MKMILVVSLEFSRCHACGPEFLVELKQKCLNVWGQKNPKTNVRLRIHVHVVCESQACVHLDRHCRHKTHPSLIRCLWVSASSMLAFYMECFHQDIPICESVLGTLGTAGVRQHIRGKIWWKCGNWGVQAEAQGCVDASCAMCPWSDILIK